MQRVHRMQRSGRARCAGPRSTTLALWTLCRRCARAWPSQSKYMLLQRALARLVADRAVDRVVDQRELEHLRARTSSTFGDARSVTSMLVGDRRVAGRHQLGLALDVDQALAAHRRRRQARVVAEEADVGAERALHASSTFVPFGTWCGLPSIVSVTVSRSRRRRAASRRSVGLSHYRSHSPPIMFIMPNVGTMSAMNGPCDHLRQRPRRWRSRAGARGTSRGGPVPSETM